METWYNLLANVGLATLMIAGMGYGLWRSLSWAGRELVIPARDRFLTRIGEFFDRVDTNLDRIETSLEKMTASMERMTSRVDDQYKMCEANGKHIEDVLDKRKGCGT